MSRWGDREIWQKYGATATLANVATGDVRVEVFRGHDNARETMQVIADHCDALGPSWRVRTISTPHSIRNDLRRNRDLLLASLTHGRARRSVEALPTYEVRMLGRIGRRDLLEVPPRQKERERR